MSTTITFRTAHLNEIRAVSKVLAESWKSAYKNIVDDEYLSSLPNDHWVLFLDKGLKDGTIDCIIAQSNQSIVGVSIIRKSLIEQYPEDSEMVSLYLLPNRMGHGIGHQLMCAVEKFLRQKGYTHCVLDVLSENARAIKFYQSHGFKRTQHTANTVLGRQELTCIIMRKAL